MTRKLSKEEIKDKFDGEELDLSLCNLAKVPVREMVSVFFASDQRLFCLWAAHEFSSLLRPPANIYCLIIRAE